MIEEEDVISFVGTVSASFPTRLSNIHFSTPSSLLIYRFFALEPKAKSIFGFRDNQSEAELIKSRRFLKHAAYFIQMIDKALGMLGPDIELLTEILLELGQKHVAYGVKPEYFPSSKCVCFAVS